jgi:acyl carrier protein
MRIELSFEKMGGIFEAGCDEAGRGCLAGPVVAAAVILSEPILGIDDSKKLNEKTRLRLAEIIKSSCVAFGIGCVSPRRIDEINILNEVIQTLNEVIGQAENRQIFTLETRLLGSIPEFDSMAVVTVLSELEARFGLIFDDDELDGSIFQNVESLVTFISAKRAL